VPPETHLSRVGSLQREAVDAVRSAHVIDDGKLERAPAAMTHFRVQRVQFGAFASIPYRHFRDTGNGVSGAAGLVLSSALLTSRIVPRNLSMLGVIGYPVFLVGSILAMFSVIDVTHGAGTVALVPGGLFELILPIWLFAKGFASHQIDAS
jgi:hypothetical protein